MHLGCTRYYLKLQGGYLEEVKEVEDGCARSHRAQPAQRDISDGRCVVGVKRQLLLHLTKVVSDLARTLKFDAE